MHFQIGMRRKMREDLAHPGLNPLSFFISSNCQTSVLDFGISLRDRPRILFLFFADSCPEFITEFFVERTVQQFRLFEEQLHHLD